MYRHDDDDYFHTLVTLYIVKILFLILSHTLRAGRRSVKFCDKGWGGPPKFCDITYQNTYNISNFS